MWQNASFVKQNEIFQEQNRKEKVYDQAESGPSHVGFGRIYELLLHVDNGALLHERKLGKRPLGHHSGLRLQLLRPSGLPLIAHLRKNRI